MKFLLLCSVIFLLHSDINGQISIIKPLKIGDTIPDIYFKEVLNYKDHESRISDFRGKLIILDFWSTWCATCIEQFPRLNELQKKFKNEIFILSVGFDGTNEASIKKFYMTKKGKYDQTPLPIAVQSKNDTILMKLFPFSGLPFEVWVDKNGLFIGSTDHKQVNEDQIYNLLTGKTSQLGIYKVKRYLNPNENFLIDRGNDLKRVYGSKFTEYNDSLRKGEPFERQFDSTMNRLYDVNKSVIEYYKKAYSIKYPELLRDADNKLIIIESNNNSLSKSFINVKDKSLNFESLFCYELIMPKDTPMERMHEIMIQDLDSNFKLKSNIVSKTLEVFCLIRTGKIIKSPENNSQRGVILDDSAYHFINIPASVLINTLNSIIKSKDPIIDLSHHDGLLTLSIPRKSQTLEELNKALSLYKLKLIKKSLRVNLLEIKNKP